MKNKRMDDLEYSKFGDYFLAVVCVIAVVVIGFLLL